MRDLSTLPPATKVSVDWRERSWAQQCTYVRPHGPLQGTRCKRWSIKGGYVCPRHGGSFPTVRAGARARLEALAPFAAGKLGELLMDKDPRIVLRTAKYILQFCEIHPNRLDKGRGVPPPSALASGADSDAAIEALVHAITSNEPAELETPGSSNPEGGRAKGRGPRREGGKRRVPMPRALEAGAGTGEEGA